MYNECNHKICSDCFCEITKMENKLDIKKINCCLCRNPVNTMLFLDENTRLNVLSKHITYNIKISLILFLDFIFYFLENLEI